MQREQFWPTKETDLAITYVIMQKFAEEHDGQLSLFISKEADENEVSVPTLSLPPWVTALAVVLKTIHGEGYYAFVLDLIVNELIDKMVAKGMPAENAEMFRLAVRAEMINKEETLH